MRRTFTITIWLVLLTPVLCAQGQLEPTPFRVTPQDSRLTDARSEPLRSLNSYFPFDRSRFESSIEDWQAHARQLRMHIKMSLGLHPMPPKTPLNAVIHGNIDQGDYTIEKVYFESMPGFLVTGNLYRPKNLAGNQPVPAILCPHGHYKDGRFREAPDNEIDQQIKSGGEQFRSNAKSPLQARCAHLARMGCIVFHYDMIGYADSQQISFETAHRFARQRPEMNQSSGWGLFSPRAESHLQSVMGLQTWNSIRALDFLETLPQVDKSRLAVTGSSGGGTQTFMLCAVDPRPAVAFPAVMVSTAMQGGCTCENCCYLRIGTGNVEFAALFAPKPLGLTAADDWTREMETKGFPQLKALYEKYGQADNVTLLSRTEFPHNFNQVSREAMYRWFDKHLGLNGRVAEAEIQFLPRQVLSVFDEQHPRPAGGPEFEKKLLSQWARQTSQSIEAAERPQLVVVDGLRKLLMIDGHWAIERADGAIESEYQGELGFHKTLNTVPKLNHKFVSFCVNDKDNPVSNCVLWLEASGKLCMLDEQKKLLPHASRLYNNGFSIMGLDTLMQGEFLADQSTVSGNRRVENGRDAACYTYGYNQPLFVSRVRDVVAMIEKLDNIKTLVGLDEMAPVAVVAAAVSGKSIQRLAVACNGFRFADADLYDANFFPGAARFGDLPEFLKLSAGRETWVAGEVDTMSLIEAFDQAENSAGLTLANTIMDKQELREAITSWILSRDGPSNGNSR